METETESEWSRGQETETETGAETETVWRRGTEPATDTVWRRHEVWRQVTSRYELTHPMRYTLYAAAVKFSATPLLLTGKCRRQNEWLKVGTQTPLAAELWWYWWGWGCR